ncbi:MAG: tetratricopeptide repeat protein, partial [Bacteroidota bacterium]
EQYLQETTTPSLRHIEAKYYIALAALYLDHPEALLKLEQFIREYPYHPKTVQAYYALGDHYYLLKDYQKTIFYLEKVETDRISAEKRIETQFKLAYAYLMEQQYAPALTNFSILKKYPNTYTQAANYYSGFIYFKQEKYEEALVDLTQVKNDPTYQSQAVYLITYIYYTRKKYDEVIAYGEGLKGNQPADVYLLVGDAYYQKKMYPQAATWFTQYQKAKGGKLQGEIAYRVAHTYYEIQQYEQAIQGFKEVAAASDPEALSPLAQNATYHLGLSYMQVENKPFALNAFAQSRQATHYPRIARLSDFYYGKVAFDLGQYATALEVLKLYVREYPTTPEAQEANELISEAYLNNDNYQEAIDYIASLPQRNTNINKAYQKLTFAKGSQDYNQEAYESAVKYFQQSAQIGIDKPLEAKAWYYMGEAFSIGKRYQEAIPYYQKALALSTERVIPTRYALAYAHYNLQAYDEATNYLQQYIAAKPANKTKLADAYIRLADCYYIEKAYDRALDQYDNALNTATKDEDYVYYQKGVIWSLKGKENLAETSLQKVLRNYKDSPYYDEALFQLAQIDLQQNRLDAAIKGFSQLIEERPQSNTVPYALLRRAVAYNSLGDKEKAVTDYKRIVDDYTTQKVASNALYGLQALLGELGRDTEFQGVLAKYKANNPDDNTLESIEFEAAKNVYFAQNYPKAIQVLELFLQEHPESELAYDATYYLAEAYYRNNNPAEALRYHEQVVAAQKSSSYTRSLQRTAELIKQEKGIAATIPYYRLLSQAAVNKREEAIAWTGLIEGYYQTTQYDSTLYFASKTLAQSSNQTAINTANLYKGKVAYAQDDLDTALNTFLQTTNTAKDERGAEAQYRLAEVLYQQKQYKQSIEALFELNDRYRTYAYWRGKAYLLIADNYIALDEIFQAKATLNSIIDNAEDKALVVEAKKKLDQLK